MPPKPFEISFIKIGSLVQALWWSILINIDY